MTSVVTPSNDSITAGQIGKVQDLLAAALRKSGLLSEPVQTVLETQGDQLAADMLVALRKRVEAISNLIVPHATVNRKRNPKDALKATGRNLYVTDDVVKAMPKGAGTEVDVVFFKLDLGGGYISDDNLEKEYELRGLVPADPFSLAAVNEADPAFADDHPNGTHWKDSSGKWCFETFYRWGDERRVHVDRNDLGWDDDWWFAGLRK
jgi:hypothetical protein